MSFVAVAIGGSAIAGLGSAYIGSQAAKSAADTQAKAAENSLAFQKQVFNQQQENYKPYLDIGKGATYTLSNLTGANGNTPDYSSFYNSPDYKFAQQQGELGIERGANARGLNLSGGTLKDLASFNSGLATQNYGNYFNRLMGLAQLGGNAASGSANTSTGMANSIGNTTQAIGQANASGTIGSANAWMSGLNNTASNSLLAAYLGKNPSAYSGGNSGGSGGWTASDSTLNSAIFPKYGTG